MTFIHRRPAELAARGGLAHRLVMSCLLLSLPVAACNGEPNSSEPPPTPAPTQPGKAEPTETEALYSDPSVAEHLDTTPPEEIVEIDLGHYRRPGDLADRELRPGVSYRLFIHPQDRPDARTLAVEYVPGTSPLVLAAPHGGWNAPEWIPATETRSIDSGTLELTRRLRKILVRRTGETPHMVLNHLRSDRLNPVAGPYRNTMAESVDPAGPTVLAYFAFHEAIRLAMASARRADGTAHLFEIHAQDHAPQRTEFGQMISPQGMQRSDEELDRIFRDDTGGIRSRTTIRQLAEGSPTGFAELVRGESSLGGLLEARGFDAMPSPRRPVPLGEFWQASRGTLLHGTNLTTTPEEAPDYLDETGAPHDIVPDKGEGLDATLVETPHPLILSPDGPEFAEALAGTFLEFLSRHGGPSPS